MPIFHIMGNVSSDPLTGQITPRVEPVNDVSSVLFYKGIYTTSSTNAAGTIGITW
jgi:hypothetical protein